MTAAWTGYSLAAERIADIDRQLARLRIKKQLPKASALASCAESAWQASTSVNQLSDTTSVLRKISTALRIPSSAANCTSAFRDLDTQVPDEAKVKRWPDYTGKLTGTSSEVAKYAAPFDEIFQFCRAVHLPKFGC
jgi:hypothetical protein